VSFVAALASALVHFVWQGGLVAFAVLVADRALGPGASARHRYAVDLLALAAMVSSFAMTLASGLLGAPPPAATPPPVGPPGALVVVGVWAVGATVMWARLGVAVWGLHRLRATARPLVGPWADRFAALSGRVGLSRPIVAAESTRIDVPMVVGWFRPWVLLPAGLLCRCAPEHIEAVLLHELSHVRRLDAFVNLVQAVIEAVLFYHPAVWWISRRARVHREHCCDDATLSHGIDAVAYARALVEIEVLRSRCGAVPTLASRIDGATLRERIERIVRPSPPQLQPRRWAVSVLASCLVVSFAIVAGVAASEPDDEPTSPAPVVGVSWLPDDVKAHAREVQRAAARHGVDPDLLAIVAFVESRGDPRAVSPAGARGLMQLMPSTAESIAADRGITDHTEARLDDPAYNLDLGAYHLADQLRIFGQGRAHEETIALAAAAYNAGQSRVYDWLRGQRALPDETQRYTAIVAALYRERHQPRSPTLDALRRGEPIPKR
jgi:beta-lactamase regulating signal transducer with metallopeptidase domain